MAPVHFLKVKQKFLLKNSKVNISSLAYKGMFGVNIRADHDFFSTIQFIQQCLHQVDALTITWIVEGHEVILQPKQIKTKVGVELRELQHDIWIVQITP